MKKLTCWFIIAAVLLISTPSKSKELYLFCAMGAKEPVKEIIKAFEKENHIKVFASFSSSGRLARQIEAGAPCDLFISASPLWVDYLKRKKLVIKEAPIAKTRLVLVSAKGFSAKSFKDLCRAERVALGNYRFAPFGKYAKEALKNLGMWECIRDRVLLANDVAQATMWVITENADSAVIYLSDYVVFKEKLKLVGIFPEKSHSPIIFTAAAITPEGERLLKFLKKKSEIFKRWGFEAVSH
ncbi:MAG: molybdate ABC transporter substrate-binding protein [Deferribacteres bacterium]|nr:molybdate ABC transporter substrate-binding protein [Deferribacteres bacterium]